MKLNLLSLFGKKQAVNVVPTPEEIVAVTEVIVQPKKNYLCIEDARRVFVLYREGGEVRQLANSFNVFPYVIDIAVKSEGAAGQRAALKVYEKRKTRDRLLDAGLAGLNAKAVTPFIEVAPSVEVVPSGELMTKAIIEAKVLKEVLTEQQRKLAVQEAMIKQLATRCDRLQEQTNKASTEQALIRSDLLKNDEAVNQMLGMTVGHKNQIGKIFAMCKSAGIPI